ncbi:MAG: metallophosphoesterase [Thermodesulfobacteriota bacterium]|nr:metallophosphoesterase [Thermodesulfobacteriota bacterium]
MRIIYITDIHDTFVPLKTVFDNTTADVYLLAGDLLYRTFPRYETAWRYIELQEILSGYRARQDSEESLWDVTQRLCLEQKDSHLAFQAKEYMSLSDRAEKYMRSSYKRLETILSRYPEKRILVLPGNYDMDLCHTILKDRNIHLQCVEVDGVRIAGYGGAKVRTPGTPDHLQVPFRENVQAGKFWSEAQEFFGTVDPDILVTHHPPYGHLDRLPGRGHIGSVGIRNYIDTSRVSVVFSGHLHADFGGEAANGTFYFNPSHFGRVVDVTQVHPGGYFLDLILVDGGFQVATLRQVERKRIYDVVDYSPKQEGLETLILDKERYVRMGGRVPKTHHIKPIRHLKRIKSFFLGYETPESQKLVSELRGIYRRLKKDGMNVAFDLLGSLNFGMAKKGSDIDLVVYLKGQECLPDELDTCTIPRPVSAVFQELKERNLDVEVTDSIDLDRVSKAIQEEDQDDGHLQRFIFYRSVCRPVNLRLIKQVEDQLLFNETFRMEVESKLRESLRIIVSSVSHVRSFDKYVSRLQEAGITIPRDVRKAIQEYLGNK